MAKASFFEKLFGKKNKNQAYAEERAEALDIEKPEYTDLGNGTCKVTGRGGNRAADISVPDEIDGLKVVEIDIGSFANDMELVSITIPGGVTKIADGLYK